MIDQFSYSLSITIKIFVRVMALIRRTVLIPANDKNYLIYVKSADKLKLTSYLILAYSREIDCKWLILN